MHIFAANGLGGELGPKPSEVEQSMDSQRRRYAKYLARTFLASPAVPYLLKPLSEAQQEDREIWLEDQLDLALQFSARLWTHRSLVRCDGLDALRDQGHTAWAASSELVQAYQTQELEPAEVYESLPFVVLAQPAVVACGTEEGEGYAISTRVWLKARVWVVGAEARKEEHEEAAAA